MALSSQRGVLLAIAIVLLLSAIFSLKGVLQDIHWDAPIYLQRGRDIVETPYLREMAGNARAIANDLRHFKADQGESTPYWSFIRLGNSVLLAGLTAIAGPGVGAVYLAFCVYIILLMASIVLMADTSRRTILLLDAAPARGATIAGAIVSAGLYVASDVSRHLAGNFVAEVPALFLLAASLWALVQAIALRSLWLASASGLAAFLMYVVKMDSIWVWLTFLALLSLLLRRSTAFREWAPMIVAAAGSAVAGYLLYALWFWPLPDPRLLSMFQHAHIDSPDNGVAPIKLWVAAGGFLWVGLLLGFCCANRKTTLWLAAAWLILVFLPYSPGMIEHRQAQVRIYAMVMAPLMLASTIGWAGFLRRWSAGTVPVAATWLLGCMLVAGVAISQQESYSALRKLPGGWRLQIVKAWLSPPQYERLSYPLGDLDRLSKYLYGDQTPKILVIDRPKNAELVSLIEVLRPPAARASGGVNSGREEIVFCGRRHKFDDRIIVSTCLTAPTESELAAVSDRLRVLYLQRLDGDLVVDHPSAGAEVIRSGPLLLRSWTATEQGTRPLG